MEDAPAVRKIISKILATRPRSMLHKIISPFQAALVPQWEPFMTIQLLHMKLCISLGNIEARSTF